MFLHMDRSSVIGEPPPPPPIRLHTGRFVFTGNPTSHYAAITGQPVFTHTTTSLGARGSGALCSGAPPYRGLPLSISGPPTTSVYRSTTDNRAPLLICHSGTFNRTTPPERKGVQTEP
ncbi:unnamed protein product [Gadus morhua 'NCC']